jgi:LysM repeat protein
MTSRTGRTILLALFTCIALPAWGQQYLLYTPQRLPAGQKPATQEGILVQEIEVQKGDTLYALSRKFGGRGMYYPQILLFNSIKNPNLIYPGNTLRIPVSLKKAGGSDPVHTGPAGTSTPSGASGDKKTPAKAEAVPPGSQTTMPSPVSGPGTGQSVSETKTGGTQKNRAGSIKRKTAAHVKKKPSQGSQAVVSDPSSPLPAPAGAAASQKLFEAAVKAYRQDDCRTALELLDRYLADNSDSVLAADANLYKAECYLKLSAQ